MDTSNTSGAAPRFATLSDDEIVTLRRVAFGQSETRTLRRADLDRLRRLRLIEDSKDGPRLTASGKVHVAALPKSVFADAPKPRREPPPVSAPPRQFEPRDNRRWQTLPTSKGNDPAKR
jgi:hypothetical protein